MRSSSVILIRGEPQIIITRLTIVAHANTPNITHNYISAAVAAHAPQVREGFSLGIIAILVLDRGREVTCYRTLLLSLRVHASTLT